jgi:ABC-type cobalamin/Fe3+-siderophores transport system ATPase subunit
MSSFYITKIKINWFGHLSCEGTAKFTEGVNVLLGKNGSGKTSILNMISGIPGQKKPGVALNEAEVIANDDNYYVRVTVNSGAEDNDHIDFPKSNQQWQNAQVITPEKVRYVTSNRSVKNELSVSNFFKVQGYDIPDPSAEINVSDEFNKAIISEMLDVVRELRGKNFTVEIEEAYRKGLVDFEKDIKIDFDRDNPVYFVDHRNREVSILNLSAGEREYLYFYAYLRRIRADESKIILIDEPELHLHGNQIRRLCELISELGRKNQVIIATHSSDVLHHFFRTANIALVERGKISNPVLGEEFSEAIEELGIPIDPSFFTAHWICAENKGGKRLAGTNSPTTQEALVWIFGNNRTRRYWSFGGSRVNVESSLELISQASSKNSDARLSVILDGDKLSFPDKEFPPKITNPSNIPGVMHFPFWEIENIFLNPALINKVIESQDGKSGSDLLWENVEKNKTKLMQSYLKTTLRNHAKSLWKDNFFKDDPLADLENWKKKAESLSIEKEKLEKLFENILTTKDWKWIPGKEVLKIVEIMEAKFWDKVRNLINAENELTKLISCTELTDLESILDIEKSN